MMFSIDMPLRNTVGSYPLHALGMPIQVATLDAQASARKGGFQFSAMAG